MTERDFNKFLQDTSSKINSNVLARVDSALALNPDLRPILNPAFPYPQKLRIGIVNNCLAVEYIGPNNDSILFDSEGVCNEGINIYDFLGLDINHLNPIRFPVQTNVENMSFFLGNSMECLTNYFYDVTQLPSESLTVNCFLDFANVTNPIFVSNTNFYWTDENGNLKIKHIDFLEIFPRDIDGNVFYHDDTSLMHFSNFIINYKVHSYKTRLHGKLNEFIEFINLPDTTEPRITSFLSENPEILQLAFGLNELNPQVLLEWQYETTMDNLQPDFMPERMDGYSDLLEFKLPYLKNNPMVGTIERRHPSFEIDNAIAQLNTYEEWCSQHVNIKWLERTQNIKLFNPRKILIIGHSIDFSKEDRARLECHRNTTIRTYDEFINMARYQLYRMS